jgi:hypothetical protein
MTDRRTLPFLVAVETDPLRYHGEHPLRPRPLATGDAEQLLAHLAADLAKLMPTIGRQGLCLAGALYDQAQILRPAWPLFTAMAGVAERRWSREPDTTGLLSIGESGGRLPGPEFVPDPALPPGMLQILPLQLHGDAGALDSLEEAMEHRFMEEGQLSPLSARALENAFGVATTHARFLTLTDLRAMLKLQLEHIGFAGLWELIDAALEEQSEPLEAVGASGTRFTWRDGTVVAEFETFDHWAREGGGREHPSEDLASSYAARTREYRQFLVTLAAHGVPVTQRLAGTGALLEGSFLEEDAGPAPGEGPAVTEHQERDVGLVAVTVVANERLRHFYPLAPEGSNALHAHIAGMGIAHDGLSYPGCLCFDPRARRLVADCD